MARQLTQSEKEYLSDAMRGYLNGFNDCGEEEYPKLTVEKLALYGYETIEFDGKYGEVRAKKMYFCGKDAIISEAKKIIKADAEYRDVCIDWEL